MSKIDRREFLRLAASGAGLGLLPPAIARALSIPAASVTGTIKDVQNVVILMQENRSFEHYFGTMPGVRGFGDRFTIPQPNGASVFQQSDGTRSVLPYYLDSTQGNGLGAGGPHSWDDAHDAWDDGRMTSWPKAKGEVSMGYLKPADLPFHTALANTFTICDNYHCSLHGGTNSNRIHLWTGANHGTSNGGIVAVINNDGWDSCAGTPLQDSLTWTTYPERLQAAGVSWKVYQQLPDNFTDNPLSGFLNYRNAYSRVNNGNLASYSDVTAGLAVPYSPTMDIPGSPDYEPLYKGIGDTDPDYGDYLAVFTADAAADQLPQVSWIVGPAMYTEHSDYVPAQGAYYIQRIIDALTANPAVWAKTVLFINYDENDCFFDHMPPPNPPSSLGGGVFAGKSTTNTTLDYLTMPVAPGSGAHASDGKPHGPGPRVPMFVVSPFSRGGFVNSETFDHTSVLRFLEQRFGVMETNITPWRRAAFGDLTSAFDFANPNDDTSTLLTTFPPQDLAVAEAQYAQQSSASAVPVPAENAQTFPVQPMGTLPSRPLPYVLNVSANAEVSSESISLSFLNSGTAGAVFHVYDRLNITDIPRRYTVEAGKHLSDSWQVTADQGSAYDLWVLGPNGFHRLFRGVIATSAATIGLEVTVAYDSVKNTVAATLINTGSAPATFIVTANAYRTDGPWTYVVPGNTQQTQTWDLAVSMNWYDFTVRVDGGFTRRFAGRIEIGSAGVSDPAFGAAETPDAFTFPEQHDVALDSFVVSTAVALGGFPGYLPISVSGGNSPQFSIDGGAFVTSAPNVCTGQTVQVGQISSDSLDTPVETTLIVGSYSTVFQIVTTTEAAGSTSGGTAGGTTNGSTGGGSGGTTGGSTGTATGGTGGTAVLSPPVNAENVGKIGTGGSISFASLAALATAAEVRRRQGKAATANEDFDSECGHSK